MPNVYLKGMNIKNMVLSLGGQRLEDYGLPEPSRYYRDTIILV